MACTKYGSGNLPLGLPWTGVWREVRAYADCQMLLKYGENSISATMLEIFRAGSGPFFPTNVNDLGGAGREMF